MPPDAETGWSLAVVAPCVDGGDRHLEIAGEFFNGEQLIDGFHDPILRFDGCRRVDIDVQRPVIAALRPDASGAGRGFHGRSARLLKALGRNGFPGVGNSASTLGQLCVNSAARVGVSISWK